MLTCGTFIEGIFFIIDNHFLTDYRLLHDWIFIFFSGFNEMEYDYIVLFGMVFWVFFALLVICCFPPPR